MGPPELEAALQKEYASRIIAAGSSIQEVITKFSLHVMIRRYKLAKSGVAPGFFLSIEK